jgi:rhamnose utilization protein RhaD (predicted bifunctional aldolase and dehydrogenase)
MTRPHDLPDLARLSARIGADPLLIHAAGGNTSVKDGATMWIKASGTLLADALTRDIFVACDLPAIRAALASDTARADRAGDFACVPGGLRPSIETSLHAVFDQRVVVHVHCVNTLALAIRPDAEAAIAPRLAGFDWAIVPYTKPGAHLACAVKAALGPATDVVVLRNHGLIVAADTVDAAGRLLDRVTEALSVSPLTQAPDMQALGAVAGDGFVPLPADDPLHAVACVPWLTRAAVQGSLYPDHVIFCGVGAIALAPSETPGQALARVAAQGLPPPAFLLCPGKGALIRADATAGARALARCLGDVLTRLAEGAEVVTLSLDQNAELLNWDAEKYRQSLNAG